MEKLQTLESFYHTHLNLVPENIKQELGHFNVFKLDNLKDSKTKCSSYGRKEFYKISLMSGKNIYHYADKSVYIEKNALVFTNPSVPYHWEHLTEDQHGWFCIFTEDFFHKSNMTPLQNYPVFSLGGQSVFLLTNEQNKLIEGIFLKMLKEIESDYLYKFDVLRNCAYDLIHEALKTQPAVTINHQATAANRISSLFAELLERQFPIESPMQRIELRSATDFAAQLRIHVNHLNKALKTTTGKTTSTIITERILQEARVLLKHTQWTVSEISYCLGFDELPHFINFFKKNIRITPKSYRDKID
ncbi:MAG TPA: helix-turn-helix transcriptional regulator [Puia sp.]